MSNISRYLLKSVYAISHKKVENYITFYTNLLVPEVEVKILFLMKGGANFFFNFLNFLKRLKLETICILHYQRQT